MLNIDPFTIKNSKQFAQRYKAHRLFPMNKILFFAEQKLNFYFDLISII